MIKKRNTSGKERIEVGDVSSTPTSFLNNSELTTYRDEAIMVLDLLEKQNIDIYNPENKPGMYLKRKTADKTISNNLKQQFNSLKTKEDEIPDQNLSNLFQHLKNNNQNGKAK